MQVDLRADTITRPSPARRRAMADSGVGDGVCHEPRSAHWLEAEVASLRGKEAVPFVPTGITARTRKTDLTVLRDETNIVLIDLRARAAAQVAQRRPEAEVLVNAITPTGPLRGVTHRAFEAAHIDAALGMSDRVPS